MTRTLWLRSTIVLVTAGGLLAGAAALAQNKPAKPEAKPSPNEQAILLGQFSDWGAYMASPGGKKVCFALAKPTSAVTEPPGRNRDPSYAFVSTRPAEKVKNEVSVIVGYPQKPGVDASATIGSSSYVMYTQNDGAWVKNAAEEAQMVEAMRKGSDMVIKSVSTHNTKTTDTYSLKGLSEALDKVAEECK
jgi:invasion protein IalB